MFEDGSLFNRKATVKVQSRSGVFESTEGRPVLVEKDFTGLRVQFSLEKTSESTPNKGRVTVYNLSPASRSFVETVGQTLILSVGYAPISSDPKKPLKESVEIIFQGDISKAVNQRVGPDWTTTWEIGDAEKKLKEIDFNKSFESGITLSKAIDEVSKSFGLAVSRVSGIKDKVFKSGLTLSGGAKEVLDSLTADGDVEWNVQDNEIQIMGQREGTSDDVIIVSPQTGLIDSPIKKESGCEAKSLINPKFRPGRRIEIRSRDLNGVYRIRKVNFDGDTHEGDWLAKIECVEVSSG